jgi:uncharacterized protein
MGNPVLHFEVTAKTPKKLMAFYKAAFDWKFERGPHKGVHCIDTGTRKGVKGMLLEQGGYIPDYVSFYVGVKDMDKALAKIVKAGGQIIRPEFSPGGRKVLAIVLDPEGHVITLQKIK